MNDWFQAVFRRRGWITGTAAALTLWGAHPTRASWLTGGALCLLGESVRLWAIGCTGAHTRKHRVEAPTLVTTGPYSLVRHPLYLGNCFNALGVYLAACGGRPTVTGLAAAGAYLLLLYGSLIALEESFLLQTFGAQFQAYRARVPLLWPRTWRPVGAGFAWRRLRYEATTLGWMSLIWSWLWLRL